MTNLIKNDLQSIEQSCKEFEFKKTALTFSTLNTGLKNLHDHLDDSLKNDLIK